jgi:hypothetical protein
MGQELTPDQVHVIMSELDLDQSGTIGVSEFLDKLKLAENVRRADMRKCKKLFEEADKDGSGTLDYEEIVWVGQEMGLGEQMKSQEFVEHMMTEMQAGHLLKDHNVRADGSISPKLSKDLAGLSSREAFFKAATHATRAFSPPKHTGGSTNVSKTHGRLDEMSSEEVARTLHVGNIESGGELENDDALTKLFEAYGEVASVTLRKKVRSCSPPLFISLVPQALDQDTEILERCVCSSGEKEVVGAGHVYASRKLRIAVAHP